MLTLLRRALNYRVTVAALIEIALWLAIPYIIVGLVFTFLYPDHVQQFEDRFQNQLPAGAELVGFAASTLLWPVLLLTPGFCSI